MKYLDGLLKQSPLYNVPGHVFWSVMLIMVAFGAAGFVNYGFTARQQNQPVQQVVDDNMEPTGKIIQPGKVASKPIRVGDYVDESKSHKGAITDIKVQPKGNLILVVVTFDNGITKSCNWPAVDFQTGPSRYADFRHYLNDGERSWDRNELDIIASEAECKKLQDDITHYKSLSAKPRGFLADLF